MPNEAAPTWDNSTDVPTWENSTDEAPTWENSKDIGATATATTPAPPVQTTAIDPTVSRHVPDIRDVTKGGPKLSLPDAGVALKTAGEDILQGIGEVQTHESPIPTPFTIGKDEHPLVAAGKEVVNLAVGVPQFFTTALGVEAAAAGAAAPTIVAGAFTIDFLKSLGQQIHSAYKNWSSMTPSEKTVAVTDAIGTGAFAGLTGRSTVKGATAFAEGMTPRGTGISPEAAKLAPATAQAVAETTPKEPNASEIPSTTSVPEPEIRPRVGEETSLRQQGQTSTAQTEAALKESQAVIQPENVAPGDVTSSTPGGGMSTKSAADQARQAEANRKMQEDFAKEVAAVEDLRPTEPALKEFTPAIKTSSGKIITGESHREIRSREISGQHGFVDSSGKFLTLTEVARMRMAQESSKPPSVPNPSETATPEPAEGTEGVRPIGMGGAVPGEFAQSPQTPTSIRNAQVDVERAKRGLPPAIQPARRAWPNVWDEAMAKIDNDPGYPDRLLTDLRNKPRSLTDAEDATLLHRQIDLQNEYGKATRDLAQAFDDGRLDAVESEKARVNALSDQLFDLYEIGKRVGTETGRGLNARKMLAYEDFSLAKMELEKRAVNDGKPLSDTQRAEVVELNKRIEETQKRFDDYKAQTEARDSERAIKDALDEAERAATKEPVVEPHVRIIADKIKTYFDNRADAALKRLEGKLFTISPQVLADLTDLGVSRILGGAVRIGEWSAKMVEAVGEKVKPHLQTIWDASQTALNEHVEKVAGVKSDKVKRAVKGTPVAEQIDIARDAVVEKVSTGKRNEVSPLAQKLARLFIEQGITERDPLIDAVHDVLKQADPAFTRRETMDAISGYGDFKQLNKDEISVQLRDLKGQMQQIGKIEDMQAKMAPKKTGIERRSPSDEERRLIKLVNEQKKKGGFVVTDPTTQLASALQARKTYYTNRISDLKTEIATRERLVKTKTPSPTDAKLDALKAEYETLRKEHAEIFEKPGLTDAQRLEMAEKSATRQIDEIERQLKTGEIFPAGKKPFKGTSPVLEAAKARIEALKAERQWAREAAGPNPQPLDVEAQQRSAELDKRIADLESQIKHETVFAKGKTERVDTPENAAKLKEIEALKDQRQFIRERLQPKPERDLDALALTAKKARLTRQIADLRDKLARGDFTKKEKRVVKMDAEADKLSFEANQAKADWHKALMLDRLAKRSVPAKILGGIGEVLNTSRAILTSMDLSAVLRQGGFIAFGHPVRALKSFPAMFRAFRSEAGQHAVDREIVSRKNYPIYNQSKLYLSEHGQKLSQMEEAYMSRWADKIPLVAGSQRAYVTFLNKLRADSFDAMAKSLGRTGELTPVEANAISNFINVSTGRGSLGMKENALVGLNTVFFAPRYVASRFQLLAGQPLYRGTTRTRVAVAKEYGRFLIGVAVVYALAKMDGATIEQDPRSSDFGKIKYGNTRIDPMAGLLQNTVLLSRLATGEIKPAKGGIVPIRGDKVPFGGSDATDVVTRFLRSKLSPAIGTGLNLLTGKDVVGQPVTAASTAENLLIPLSLQDIYATMIEQGVPRGTALSILSIFGMGLQNYEDKKGGIQPTKK